MKQPAVVVFVALVSLLSAGWATEESSPAQLAFEARPVKERFADGEQIRFRFRLQNVGPKEVLVFEPLLLYISVHLRITAPDGNRVQRCGPIPLILWREEDFKLLGPGEKLEELETISCQGAQGPPEDRWGYAISAPGKYTVQSEYRAVIGKNWIRAKEGKPIPFYRGAVSGPPVEFIIEAAANSLPPPRPLTQAPGEPHYWGLSPLLIWVSLTVLVVLAVLYVALRKKRA